MLCVKECSENTISATETVKVKVAGRELEWGKLDIKKCTKGFQGSNKQFNPFKGEHSKLSYIQGHLKGQRDVYVPA